MNDIHGAYLSLLKRCLCDLIYTTSDHTASMRVDGADHPERAHTMIGMRRLDNLQFCVESVLRDGVPGDLIETGVWRGGACIFMRGLLKAYGDTDRTVWVADSFDGLPPPDPAWPADVNDLHHKNRYLAVHDAEVERNFRLYGMWDRQVRLLKGWFKDTLPSAPINRLAVLRLDGDMYGSTMDALVALYPKLSRGGFVIVDDYFLQPCQQAIHDYRATMGIDDPIENIDGFGVFWRRR